MGELVDSSCLIIHLFAELSKFEDDIMNVDNKQTMNCALYVYEEKINKLTFKSFISRTRKELKSQ